MVRTQIQLTEDQAQRLKELSLTNHESIASMIRKAIDQFLISGQPNRAALYRQASSISGKYEADRPDIAVEHDRYLAEDYGS